MSTEARRPRLVHAQRVAGAGCPRNRWAVLLAALALFFPDALAEPSPRSRIAEFVAPPFSLGEPAGPPGVWALLNSGGAQAGYVIETEPLAPLPGFSGLPINVLVIVDNEGTFTEARLLDHNEPIFVSGLGETPFREFFNQYRGHSISSSLVVGTPYGGAAEGSGLVHLDGVAKATASVRIAHESVLAATLAVAREKMGGIKTGPAARPDPDYREALDWRRMVSEGIASRTLITNRELQDAFAETLWADDDPEALADPDGVYLDLWIVDLGPPSIADAVLDAEGRAALRQFLSISGDDEPLLVIDAGRHGLVSDDFVRNTAPDRLTARQSGFPVALRDADLLFGLHPDLPPELHAGSAMILRSDRRLGFDPASPWELVVESVRQHGMFRPEIGRVELIAEHQTPERFFTRPEISAPVPPWLEAVRNRARDLVIVSIALALLSLVMLARMDLLSAPASLTAVRLSVLGFTLLFIGWWGQGQLSIVTVLGTLRAAIEGGSFAFLVYDPFSLIVWAFALVGAVIWGRGFFCGWLCPFGALQEYAYRLGRALRLPQWNVSARWDSALLKLKYVALAGLVATVIVSPEHVDVAAEIEPFKTAITVLFVREWYYVAYAAMWLVLGLFLFKGFCRYVCPLGAFFALAGLLRRWNWIQRRPECGSPCQLCKAQCLYRAIGKDGRIDYLECFQCLDCVSIHDDSKRCVPLVLKARGRPMAASA